jgi:hypothetical protein
MKRIYWSVANTYCCCTYFNLDQFLSVKASPEGGTCQIPNITGHLGPSSWPLRMGSKLAKDESDAGMSGIFDGSAMGNASSRNIKLNSFHYSKICPNIVRALLPK